jgi:mannitol/fructose-specific phosphotransferase system IIA component (Ntr-type)
MKRLQDAFRQCNIALDMEARDFPTIFHKVVRQLVDDKLIDPSIAGDVEQALQSGQDQASTAIGHAVAVPHAYLDGIDEQVVMFVRLARPLNLGAPDNIPTRYLFFLLGPNNSAALHLDTLAYVARLMSDDELRYEMGEARSADDLLLAIEHFSDRTSDPIPSEAQPASDTGSLSYTGKIGGGIRLDVARRWPHYISDFKDGLHAKCLSSTMFLFFACLAPAVTFGGVMATQTGGQIGVVEMILASAFCGVVFSLVSGQPLIILGGTGPLLVFTAILFRLCTDMEIPFLPSYAWVGLWSAGFLLILAVTDASCLMRFFTRFTDEIFSALISIIFIYEAIKSLVLTFEDLDVHKHHDTALLTLLLALGTFFIAMSLSRFRRSSYLRPKIREFLADFGPALALVAMTIVAVWLHEVFLDVLNAPDKFGTTTGRAWSVSLFDAPLWVRFAAAGPALLVTVLVFLDQNITARVVNSPDHKLHKGEAYHLDLGVVGILMGICSCFGLPWLVAATVRSLNHVRSLASMEEIVGRNGETKERVIHVRENRITGLAIHLLIGSSLLLLPMLKTIPMAVLYGLFLYMGVVSMSGNQFFERLSLWLRDPALYPVTHYIRRVPRFTIHAFTLLQLVSLGVLWYVKSSRIGILFPIFIALLVPVRLLADRLFEAKHLEALDAEEIPTDEENHWA